MVGLLVLGFLIAYVAFWAFLFKRARNRLEKVASIGLAILIPFWDLPFGLSTFYGYCSGEAGIFVYSDSRPTSVLLGRGAGYRPEQVLALGFEMVEYEARNEFVRLQRNGAVTAKSTHDRPAAEIRVESPKTQQLGWHISRLDTIAVRTDTNKIVGRQTIFSWGGLWWQVGAAPLLGNGGACYGENPQPLLEAIAKRK